MKPDLRGSVLMRTRRMVRCERCHQGVDACMCDALAPIAVRTPIQVLVHHVEAWKTTNTGRLAQLTMGARYDLWGDPTTRAVPSLPQGKVLLLFPSDDARPMREGDAEGAPTLVVPDGTWNQARKIANRVASSCEGRVVRVRVETDAPSAYVFRRTAREGALSTFEALAHALSVLEGEEGPRVREQALALFAEFVRRQSRASQM
jgi:DTW domain-containing protein YfiP